MNRCPELVSLSFVLVYKSSLGNIVDILQLNSLQTLSVELPDIAENQLTDSILAFHSCLSRNDFAPLLRRFDFTFRKPVSNRHYGSASTDARIVNDLLEDLRQTCATRSGTLSCKIGRV